jgi:transcriptional regulator with XRE-family HTH domain
MQRQVNGPAIRAIRMALGIKQQDLAERSGISPSHMNKIESGAEPGRFETVARIAQELGVSVDAIAPVIKVTA